MTNTHERPSSTIGKNPLDMSMRKSFSVEKRLSGMEEDEVELHEVNMRQNIIYLFRKVFLIRK